ncbi:unnamed protein product, partial [Choristocarpus tenellus]
IDVRHHFLRDLARKGKIRVIFVGTVNQRTDVLTKNLPVRVFREHVKFVRNM